MRLAGDIFLGGSRFGAQDSDPDRYTSDDYMRALNRGGSFDLGTKENRTSWADVQDVDNNGYGDLMTTQGRAQLESDRRNPLYQRAAEELGIKSFGSANDMAQVIRHLADRGQSTSDDDRDDDRSTQASSRPSSSDHDDDGVVRPNMDLFRFG
jgi:hypothetical protein